MDTLDVDEQRVVRWSLRDSADVTWSYEEVSMPPTEDGGAYRGSVSAILPFSQCQPSYPFLSSPRTQNN